MTKQSFWLKLRSKILKRQTPFTPLHWRFFLPNQNKSVQVHRYVFLHTHKEYPIVLRMLVIIYNLTRWWFYFAWVSIFKAYKSGSKICLEKYNIPKAKQVFDLFILAFAYCIPPIEYYLMRLHRFPRASWLDFAYDFQVASWHEALCYDDAKSDQELLNNKKNFGDFLNKHNLPTIKHLQTINAGIKISQNELDKLPLESFFKPAVGNRSFGCFTLKKDNAIENDANLRFIWFKDASENPYKDLKDLNQIIRARDYLIQPVLKNHSEFSELLKTDRLTTIRLVTAYFNDKYEGMSAVLETAIPNKPMYYWNVAIDINTGKFIEPKNDVFSENEEFRSWFENLKDKQCPKWQELKSICLQAHAKLPKLLTIGWDVALTPDGPTIVEGNIGWGLKQYQQLTQQPLLQTRLGQIYAKFIDNN